MLEVAAKLSFESFNKYRSEIKALEERQQILSDQLFAEVKPIFDACFFANDIDGYRHVLRCISDCGGLVHVDWRRTTNERVV